ncbi:MAG: Ig-like domain-containing protein [Verrucomicrobiales bacterium]|nr:Ig-like domain-containing protein [Verrucomicrobiales bacterium]
MRTALAVGAAVMLLPLAEAGHLIRYRYEGSFDANSARTGDYRQFIANTYWWIAGSYSAAEVASGVGEIPATNPNIDDFGSELRGYLVAPMDGDYTLTIGTDDTGGLWVSGDHTIPADFPSQRFDGAGYREPNAEETGWTNGDLFTAARYDERTTEPITLTRGQVIYFELIGQEASGGDFTRLGWTRPDGVQELIPTDYLIPEEIYPTTLAFANGEVLTDVVGIRPAGNPASQTIPELGTVTFQVDVVGGTAPFTFQWKDNGTDLAGEDLPVLTLAKVPLSSSGHRYSCVVRDGTGASITSAQATLTVTPDTAGPVIVKARGSGNPHGILVTFDDVLDPTSAGDVANYALSGQAVTVNAATLWADTQVLLTVSEFNTDPLTLTVNGVKDASVAGNMIAPDSTAAVLLATDLEGYWPFDEGGGDTTVELVGDHHGTLVDAPTWLTADVPSLGARANPAAVLYDGVSQYTATDYSGIGGNAARTVSLWVKLTPGPGETVIDNGILAWGNSTGNGLKYHVRIEPSTGTVRTECQGGNNWATQDLRDAQWHHIVSQLPDSGTASNDDVKHFVDGVLDPQLGGADVAVNTDITSASAFPVWIGGRDQTGTFRGFPGAVDDVSIFASELSAEKIAQLAAGVSPMEVAEPIALPISFTLEPVSKVGQQSRPVTFTCLAEGSPTRVIGYQWFRDNVAIPGANGTDYTIDSAQLTDSGAQFRVEAFNLDGTFARLVSATATLTVVNDEIPPFLVSGAAIPAPVNRIDLVFNETLDQASAETPGNYAIAGVTINSIVLSADGRTVSLLTSTLTEGVLYTVQVNGVTDLVGNPFSQDVPLTAAMTYRELVLSEGPDAYWPMDDLAGTQVANLVNAGWAGNLNSNTGSTLPLRGLPGLVPNLASPAIAFVAADANRILIPDNAALNAKSPNDGYQFKTVEFWFRANTLPELNADGTPYRAFLFEQGGTTRGLSIYLSGTETADPQTAEIHFHAWNDNADAAASPWGGPESEGKTPIVIIGTVERGRTYQAVLVMDGDNAGTTGDLRAYLDGVEVGSQTGVGLFFNAGDDAGIGAINQNSVVKEDNRGVTYGDPFNGLIAEAGLSDPAVTSPNTENFSVEVITYLDLEPGVVRLGVNCDDGFRLTAGRVPGETTLIVAGRDRTGGITDERPQFPALFKVTKAGVYAFRMVYFQGNGGAGLEWHVKDGAGLSFLLNDSGSPIPAYRSRTEDPPDIVEPATLGITSDGVNAVIRFATTAGVTYEVQATETLNPPAWTAVETLLGDGAAATVTDTLGDATRFYRVESK